MGVRGAGLLLPVWLSPPTPHILTPVLEEGRGRGGDLCVPLKQNKLWSPMPGSS